MMAQARDRVGREMSREVGIRRQIKIEFSLRAFLDRLSCPRTLLFRLQREHENRVRKLFARQTSQLGNAGLKVLGGALVAYVLPQRTRACSTLLSLKHDHALRPTV